MDLVERAIPLGGGKIKKSEIVSAKASWYGGKDIAGKSYKASITYDITEKGTAYIVARTVGHTFQGSLGISDFYLKLNDEVIGTEQKVMHAVKVKAGDVITAGATFTVDSNTETSKVSVNFVEMCVTM